MSMSSVTPTASPATPTGIDAIAPESGGSPAASGFDLLLAAHGETQGGHETRDVSEKDAPDDSADTREPGPRCDTEPVVDPAPPKPKADAPTDAPTDAATLAATLAALATPLPTPVETRLETPVEVPSVGDPLDSAAVLEQAAAATPTTSAPDDPTDPVTPPAVTETDTPTLVDLPAPNVDTELASLLLAPPATDTPAPAITIPDTPLLNDHNASTARTPEKSAPTPPPTTPAYSPGPVSNDQPHPDRARIAAGPSGSSGYSPPSGPTAPTTTVVDVRAAEATAPPAPVEPPPPAEQLVSILSPLRTMANGAYTLRLELKPAELGRVEMRVEMRDGVLHASIHADHESSAQLVRSSLNELRDQLAAEGVRTGTLTVSDGALGSSGREGDARQAHGDTSRRGASTEPAFADEPSRPMPGDVGPTIDSDATSLLDVRV
jgi:flagellar hook-length control protein FliK